MKQRGLFAKILVSILLLQTSCTMVDSTVFPTAASTKAVNIAPEETVIQPVDVLRITKLHEWVFPAQNIKDMKWSPAGNYLVILTEAHIRMYDTSTFEELWHVDPIAPVYYASAAAFSPDGKTLALYTRLSGLQKRDFISGRLLAEKPEDNNPANCFPSEAIDVVLSSDGKNLFVSISMENSQQQSYIFSEIHTWNMQRLECVSVFERIEGDARALDLSFDGKFLALSVGLNTSISGNDIKENGQIAVRNLENGQRACSIGDQGSLARFKPKSSILLVPDPDEDQLVYWDAETCDIVGKLRGVTTRYNLAFSPDGQLVALWNNGISIIDSSSGIILQTIDDPVPDKVFPINRLFSFLSFSPDGKYLIYAVRREPFESMIFIWAIEK